MLKRLCSAGMICSDHRIAVRSEKKICSFEKRVEGEKGF